MDITINYKGVDFDVNYDFQPSEKEERYDTSGLGYPGSPEYIKCINEITHKGTCFLELLEDNDHEIKSIILETKNN